MNSLVVLLSVVAFATAKPSGLLDAGVLTYATPAVAAVPSAVSHQSRIDISSSPAIVATGAVAPIARTVVGAPLAAIAAPAAVSSQSRIDIKTSPGIVSTVAASPLALSAAAIAPAIAAPALIKSAAIAPGIITAPGLYKSAAIAPGVIAAPGLVKTAAIAPTVVGPAVPLDTPEVIAARAAHLQAKALAGAHLLRKRSASLVAAAPIVSTYAATPVISAPIARIGTVGAIAPLALSAPVITKAYGVHPW